MFLNKLRQLIKFRRHCSTVPGEWKPVSTTPPAESKLIKYIGRYLAIGGFAGLGSFGIELALETLGPNPETNPYAISPSFEFMVENLKTSFYRGLTWPFFGLVFLYKTSMGQYCVSLGKKFEQREIRRNNNDCDDY
jgi:hypothetical protein